jgi:hypothetical protein
MRKNTNKKLLDVVRVYSEDSTPYKEYCTLIAKSNILHQLEDKLDAIADSWSHYIKKYSIDELLPSEEKIDRIISYLHVEVHSLLQRPIDHRLGTE